MIFFPAIDIKNGQCVRLLRGDMDKATTYHQSPQAQAQIFAEFGAQYLHVVDLDGALAGRDSDNAQAIAALIKNIKIPVQLGGGIRTMAQVEAWLKLGVARVILGTAAVKDPQFARKACKSFPGKIVLGIDARGDKVALEGWVEESTVSAWDLAADFADAGAAAIIYTDIQRDGALLGPNLKRVRQMVEKTDVPVIASGGIARLADIANLGKIPNLEGVICGRALYDERFTLSEAIAAAEGADA